VIAGFCAALRRIGEEGVAVLVAGQHVRRILSLADRAYLLVEGQVAQEGTGRALLAAPAVEALLL
jgi:branched-chain amino acid transport system ATP-binding protein